MNAQTKQGALRGFERLGCLQFRGIPYATVERWRPPQPAPSWDGVREATEFGPICPQVVGTMERMAGQTRPVHPMDEDCLALNVYTESLDGSRPVMVWIHGGAFATGSGRIPWYSGHNFVRDGVVVVTINYRINAFGFLFLDELFDDYSGTGTIGIRDQVAALEWVRDNIASFGGDPSNVTIFGESAGGFSVSTLLSSPKAKGLFTKAIPQSGAAHNASTSERGTTVARAFLEIVGVEPGDADALRSLTTEQIVDALQEVGEGNVSGGRLPWQPTIGDDVVPVPPIDALRNGFAADVPVLTGTNLDEWNLFALGAREPIEGPLEELFGDRFAEVRAIYEKKASVSDPLIVWNAMMTDLVFRLPALRLAEAQVSSGAPVWMYRFDWRSPAMKGRMGAAHALEIPFVFDNLDAPGADAYTGGEGPPDVATEMHTAWVSFAKDADPGWAPYEEKRRQTMLFDANSRTEDDPDGDTRTLWDGVL